MNNFDPNVLDIRSLRVYPNVQLSENICILCTVVALMSLVAGAAFILANHTGFFDHQYSVKTFDIPDALTVSVLCAYFLKLAHIFYKQAYIHQYYPREKPQTTVALYKSKTLPVDFLARHLDPFLSTSDVACFMLTSKSLYISYPLTASKINTLRQLQKIAHISREDFIAFGLFKRTLINREKLGLNKHWLDTLPVASKEISPYDDAPFDNAAGATNSIILCHIKGRGRNLVINFWVPKTENRNRVNLLHQKSQAYKPAQIEVIS